MFPRIDKGPIEYHLNIAPAYNIEKREECVRFTFETHEEFHHFQYQITIDHEVRDGEIDFVIRGLKPRGMTMPGIGRAQSDIDLFGLNGKYTVRVEKPGHVVNNFAVAIRRLTPKIVDDVESDDTFLQVTTNRMVDET
jgi:hypothetical protein